MSKLPNGLRATLDPRKIAKYLLVAKHPDNSSKAAFFNAAGFTFGNMDVFRNALLAHPIINKVFSETQGAYGTKYVVRCQIRTPNHRNPCIDTVWIDDGDGAPRFVTADPVK